MLGVSLFFYQRRSRSAVRDRLCCMRHTMAVRSQCATRGISYSTMRRSLEFHYASASDIIHHTLA